MGDCYRKFQQAPKYGSKNTFVIIRENSVKSSTERLFLIFSFPVLINIFEKAVSAEYHG